MRKIIFTLLFLLLAASVHAATVYVDGNISPSSCGTYSIASRDCSGSDGTAYKHPQTAANAVVAGDTVLFRTGTYGEWFAVNSGTAGNPITFQNYNSEVVTIQASSTSVQGINVSNKSYLVFDGINTLGGDIGYYVHGNGSSTPSTHITIKNCKATEGRSNGIQLHYYTTNSTVENCEVYNNSRINWPRGSANPWGGGLTVSGASTNNIVQDCYIYWNHGEGLTVYEGSDGTIVRRNIISDNYSVNLYINGSANVTVDSNFVFLTNTAKNWAAGAAQQNNPLGIGASVETCVIDCAITRSINGLVVKNNIVVNNQAGFWLFRNQTPSPDFSNISAVNNTFVSSSDYCIRMDNVGNALTSLIVQNNICFGAAGGGARSAYFNPIPTSSAISYNRYNETAELFTWGSTNYTSLASYVAASGETNSAWSDALLVNYTATLPRFWSDPSLGAPDALVARLTLNLPYRLQSTSPAIDAGTPGLSTCNGTCDQGAIETVSLASCTVEDGDASTMRIAFLNNVAPPLTGLTLANWSTRKAGASNAPTAINLIGSNRVDLTLTNAIINGNAIDFTYTPGTLTDTFTQPVFAFTQQSCTNNVGGAPTGSWEQKEFAFHGLRGTEAAPIRLPHATAADNTNVKVVPGARFRLRVAVIRNTADTLSFAPKWYCSKSGGAYFAVPGSFDANNIKFYGTGDVSSDIPGQATPTTNLLGAVGAGSFVASSIVRTTDTVPAVSIAPTNWTEVEGVFELDTDVTPTTDYYECRIRQQDGTVLNTYTVTPRIDVVGAQASGGF